MSETATFVTHLECSATGERYAAERLHKRSPPPHRPSPSGAPPVAERRCRGTAESPSSLQSAQGRAG